MADHDIQKSRHLLKHLEEEMMFLNTLVSQIESLSSQVQYVSSGIKRTWSDIAKIYKDWSQHTENS
jgi:CII-binding regulator of phage lambda lysogenization HflD